MSLLLALIAAVVAAYPSQEPHTTGQVAGRVTVEGTGAGVPAAHVVLFPAAAMSRPTGMVPQTTTDQDGRFLLDGLVPGRYYVDVQKAGFVPLHFGAAGRIEVEVVAGRPTTFDVPLQKGGVISGRVLDALGEPVAGVAVMALQQPAAVNRSEARLVPAGGIGAQTNDIGEFRLSGLAKGEYYVAALPRGASPFGGPGVAAPTSDARSAMAETFFPGTTDPASATPVSVAAGAEAANVSFTMQSLPAFRVSGIVVDESGEPIADAMIMVVRDPRGAAFPGASPGTQSQADGRFTIGALVAGTYHLSAAVPIRVDSGRGGGGVAWSSAVAGGVAIGPPGAGRAASTEVVVTDADVSGVRIAVQRPRQ
jgi:hypothetical protein